MSTPDLLQTAARAFVLITRYGDVLPGTEGAPRVRDLGRAGKVLDRSAGPVREFDIHARGVRAKITGLRGGRGNVTFEKGGEWDLRRVLRNAIRQTGESTVPGFTEQPSSRADEAAALYYKALQLCQRIRDIGDRLPDEVEQWEFGGRNFTDSYEVYDLNGAGQIVDKTRGQATRFIIKADGFEAIVRSYRGSAPQVDFIEGNEADLRTIFENVEQIERQKAFEVRTADAQASLAP